MKIGKYPTLAAYGAALCILWGCMAEVPKFTQRTTVPPPREGQIGIRTTLMKGKRCGPYMEEEHWDGRKTPKIIAYYETKEDIISQDPSYFALRNGDGLTFTCFPAPGKERKCSECHGKTKVREYLFMKPGKKPI